jgi:hypothetical protein
LDASENTFVSAANCPESHITVNIKQIKKEIYLCIATEGSFGLM